MIKSVELSGIAEAFVEGVKDFMPREETDCLNYVNLVHTEPKFDDDGNPAFYYELEVCIHDQFTIWTESEDYSDGRETPWTLEDAKADFFKHFEGCSFRDIEPYLQVVVERINLTAAIRGL